MINFNRKYIPLTPAFISLSDSLPQNNLVESKQNFMNNNIITGLNMSNSVSSVADVLNVLTDVSDLEMHFLSQPPTDGKFNFDTNSSMSGSNYLFDDKNSNDIDIEPLQYLYLPKQHRILSQNSNSFHKNEKNLNTQIKNEDFQFGLTLLQANIIALCLKSGIKPHQLYPREALLLNLHILQQHAYNMISKYEKNVFLKGYSENSTESFSSMNDIQTTSLQLLINPYHTNRLNHPPSLLRGITDESDERYNSNNDEDEYDSLSDIHEYGRSNERETSKLFENVIPSIGEPGDDKDWTVLDY